MAAELDNVAPDTNWPLPLNRSVGDNLAELPELGLADAGYGKRKWSAEPPNGWIKNVRGCGSSACGVCIGCRPTGGSSAWR